MALVPNIVDQRAQTKPETLYAEYPVSTLSYEEGYRKITYGDFANAVNGVAWWLSNTLGPGSDFEALAYIGPNDLRYPALILGAAKAGYMMFLTSPRNSVAAQINLFDKLHCRVILSPSPRPPPVTTILATHEIRVVEVPTVDDLLGTNHPHFPFDKTYSEALNEPFVALHTSGSTGLPKHLIYTHACAARNMKMMSLKPPPGYESQDKVYQGKRVFLTFPPFHGAYIVSHLFNAIPFGTVMISPTSGAIPSAEGLVKGLKKTPADVAIIVPSIVQELSQNPELLDYCAKNLETIIYCGGDLPQSIGDIIASKIRLVNQFGATELGLTASLLSLNNRGPKDWKYVQFHPDLGIELRHVAEDMHELYVVRDPQNEKQQPTFTIFPDAQEYASRDLFVRHPSKDKSDLWSWRARADDIIVFLNGEKTNPISMEQHILASNTDINAVLVVGAQRFQAALLIEPVTNGQELTPAQRAAFIERIWPTIEDANRDAPTHARIVKSHILFTHPQKPMLRAGKGTVQRPGTLNMYAKEIDALYADADTMSVANGGEVTRVSGKLDDDNVSRFIRETISSITGWEELADTDDLFALGMDSLHALMAVRKIKQGLALPTIALSTLYTNPSTSALTGAILRLADEQNISSLARQKACLLTRSGLLRDYQTKIDRIALPSKLKLEEKPEVVVLTGSTGTLGSYILDSLLANFGVAHVYCLNRKTDSSSVQTAKNQVLGLPNQMDPTRATFLTADLTKPSLGLEKQMFEKLQNSATLVIHNAWPVNFNLSLPSFRPQFEGVVNLIEFVAGATSSLRLFFVSSISSVMSHRSPSLKTPEQVIHADSAPAPNGYAESKYLAELLLEYAAQKLRVSTSFVRVGQIAGAVNHAGLWNKAEWFPSLVISSLHVGAIPNSLGPTFSKVDWMPIDLLAEILVDLALHNGQEHKLNGLAADCGDSENAHGQSHVFHALNPHPVKWQDVSDVVVDELSSNAKEPLETISIESWLGRVRKGIQTAAGSSNALKDEDLEISLRNNPAVKLLDFYEDVLGSKDAPGNELEVKETLRRSARFRGLESVKAEWVRKWVREWMSTS